MNMPVADPMPGWPYPPPPQGAPPQKSWRRRHPVWTTVIGVLGVLLFLYSMGLGVSLHRVVPGVGSTEDGRFRSYVVASDTVRDQVNGTAVSTVTIINHSSVTSDYSITMSMESFDRLQTYSTVTVTATDVAPGATDTELARFYSMPILGGQIVFTSAQRTASS